MPYVDNINNPATWKSYKHSPTEREKEIIIKEMELAANEDAQTLRGLKSRIRSGKIRSMGDVNGYLFGSTTAPPMTPGDL